MSGRKRSVDRFPLHSDAAVLLGLYEGPASNTVLVGRLERATGGEVSNGALTPAFHRLVARGLVELVESPLEDVTKAEKPGRRPDWYALTDEGRALAEKYASSMMVLLAPFGVKPPDPRAKAAELFQEPSTFGEGFVIPTSD